jgi:hypothetical protein
MMPQFKHEAGFGRNSDKVGVRDHLVKRGVAALSCVFQRTFGYGGTIRGVADAMAAMGMQGVGEKQ